MGDMGHTYDQWVIELLLAMMYMIVNEITCHIIHINQPMNYFIVSSNLLSLLSVQGV